MAIQHSASIYPRVVSVWIPNEVEGQILGGTQTHVDATQDACIPLRAYSLQQGLDWLVRQEGELRYLRAAYTRPQDRIGTLYPDSLVAIGVQFPYDEPYDLTQIGIPPVLIVEIISRKTRQRDIGAKVQAYAQMGVGEYVTFDPRPRKDLELQGFRLTGSGQYQAIPPAAEGGLWLMSIGLRVTREWAADGSRGRLRFFTRDGDRLLHVEEEAARRLEAERTVREERRLRAQAEERAARLQVLLTEHGIASD